MGYSLTSDTVPQTRLWEMATYEMKPRLNRLSGVSTVVVQGGQEPEFEIAPDPAKLLANRHHDSQPARRGRRSNLIDSPGSDREQSPARAEPGERTGAHAGRDRATSSSRPRPPARRSTSATSARCAIGQAGLHDRDGEPEAGGAAEHLPPARRQHRRRGRCSPRRDRAYPRRSCRAASSSGPSTTSPKS